MHKLFPAGLVLLSVACAGLPPLAAHPFVSAPVPQTPIEVCWVDTGGLTTSAHWGVGGLATAKDWEVTSAVLVIRHPLGDLVLDTGISLTANREALELSRWKRFVFGQTAGRNVPRRSLPASLTALGVTAPKALLLSHVHADHAGGVAALPGVPVWLAAPELQLVEAELRAPKGVALPSHLRAMEKRMVPLAFQRVPYANFDESFDVFGDGSVVVVPTYGHTPGSVATFVNVSPTTRLVHVGDLINLGESIERGVGKSWVMRQLTDEDDAATEQQVAKLVQLHEQDPELIFLPAHDRRAFTALFGEDAQALPPCIGRPKISPPGPE